VLLQRQRALRREKASIIADAYDSYSVSDRCIHAVSLRSSVFVNESQRYLCIKRVAYQAVDRRHTRMQLYHSADSSNTRSAKTVAVCW